MLICRERAAQDEKVFAGSYRFFCLRYTSIIINHSHRELLMGGTFNAFTYCLRQELFLLHRGDNDVSQLSIHGHKHHLHNLLVFRYLPITTGLACIATSSAIRL
jgi:hypothetical protein